VPTEPQIPASPQVEKEMILQDRCEARRASR
jgi:hypothetical protein